MSAPQRWVHRVRASGDSGQLTLLVIGFTLILVLAITVVVNVSRVWIAQRALSAAADGAAVAAASALQESVVYAGATGDALPLARGGVELAAQEYVEGAQLPGRFDGLEVVAETDGVTVTVTLAARVDLPFVNSVSSAWADGVPIGSTASARAPLTAGP